MASSPHAPPRESREIRALARFNLPAAVSPGSPVVEDDGRGRLLRVELVFFGKDDADLVGAPKDQQLLLVGEARAGQNGGLPL
jgi:hypothetical protein